MEVTGTVLSVAKTLIVALQSSELMEVVSIFGYKDELEKLQYTVSTIQAVFQDAETKQTLSALEQKLLEDLKDVVYEAEDFMDQFVTLAEQKQLLNTDGRISNKLYNFLSRTNPLGAYNMSTGVKKLDAIVYSKLLSFVHDPEPIRMRRPYTHSYVNEADIIGREQELVDIVGKLLDPNVQHDLSVFSIVGIGGLGKTALAQLVFNDPSITSAFSSRLWTCVSSSYQDEEKLDMKELLCHILDQITYDNWDRGSTLDQLQSQLRQQLVVKRYLLVLDDVWTEKPDQLHELANHLNQGERVSWIMVTTRSQKTATIMNSQIYQLQGLSDENARRLFHRI